MSDNCRDTELTCSNEFTDKEKSVCFAGKQDKAPKTLLGVGSAMVGA